jgi:Flp pilus assembly protein TadG
MGGPDKILFSPADVPDLKPNDGVASIEFAFIASLLAFILMAVSDIGLFLYERSDMRGALHAGAYYFMMGGDSNAEAEAAVRSAWANIPSGTTISASDYCECGGLVSLCTAICTDGSVPDVYHKISIQTTYDGILFNTSYGIDEAIRIR